jgi:hypothetical protein
MPDLYCPNCHENLGKDTEQSKKTACSMCGKQNIPNSRGYNEEDEIVDSFFAMNNLPYPQCIYPESNN